ncbi:hypothetical protein STRIP9103_01725 [Streptomyces ipomoeae 91-03]|uniref:Uncharacterized protein n=1 Tax=Streptomyces ipomoeae 91-03 TaxID=698759 RepID=L1KNB5_9ACTN|nr:hypothetical protein STRIP9103_01725 [Streptomyces ipomoeae 91-03]
MTWGFFGAARCRAHFVAGSDKPAAQASKGSRTGPGGTGTPNHCPSLSSAFDEPRDKGSAACPPVP